MCLAAILSAYVIVSTVVCLAAGACIRWGVGNDDDHIIPYDYWSSYHDDDPQ
jgi:hypothetical protein